MSDEGDLLRIKEERSKVREKIFLHNDGIGLVSVMALFHQQEVLEYLDCFLGRSLDSVVSFLKTKNERVNAGALKIALRLLISQGWLKIGKNKESVKNYILTENGIIAAKYADKYLKIFIFLPKIIKIREVDKEIKSLIEEANQDWGLGEGEVENQIKEHLNGVLLGPVMIYLKDKHLLEGKLTNNNFFLKLLEKQGWVEFEGEAKLTALGKHASSMTWSYGVPVSYLPMFKQLPEIIFGDPQKVFSLDEEGKETHVDRRINVKGSSGAHKTYFKKIEEAIIEIFNKPINQQPLGIADTGCGDGTFLKHVYEVVKKKTTRGLLMKLDPEKYKLILLGIDLFATAREETRKTLQNISLNQDSEVKIISGDINNPDDIAQNLEMSGVKMIDFLHLRSFLDHNRQYIGVKDLIVAQSRNCSSTGAFMNLDGSLISNHNVEQNLVEHFTNWSKYLKHGLLVLELHTIKPEVSANNRSRTLAIPYDATHGFTGQLIVEENVFRKAAMEAGLVSDERYHTRYPNDLERVMVSIHKFNTEEKHV